MHTHIDEFFTPFPLSYHDISSDSRLSRTKSDSLLGRETEQRLSQLARKTGRTKTYYAREAILEHLEDMEDYYLAIEAAQNPGKLYSPKETRRELDG